MRVGYSLKNKTLSPSSQIRLLLVRSRGSYPTIDIQISVKLLSRLKFDLKYVVDFIMTNSFNFIFFNTIYISIIAWLAPKIATNPRPQW